MEDQKTIISIEALVGFFIGLFAAVAEIGWELRTLGVCVAVFVAWHITRRLDISTLRKVLMLTAAIAVLVSATWRPIWKSFHEDFPDVTAETALFRITIFAALAMSCLMAKVFLLQPQRQGGNRLIPVQLVAFGLGLIVVGAVSSLIGVVWQYRQNRSLVGPAYIEPGTLAPVDRPKLGAPVTLPALEPPKDRSGEPLTSGYGLTPAGVKALADAAFKIKADLPSVTVLRSGNDQSGYGLAANIANGLERGGIQAGVSIGWLAGPNEVGVMIRYDDPEHLPAPALKLKEALESVGLKVTLVKEAVGVFQLFVGPNPNG